LKAIYAGAKDIQADVCTFRVTLPGLEDAGWSAWITGAMPRRGTSFFFGSQILSAI
jgi:hypothetical protein